VKARNGRVTHVETENPIRGQIGVLAVLSLLALYVLYIFDNGFCETVVIKSLCTPDQSVKSTVYRNECGAAARTRALVALSNAKVDGTKKGDVILTLSGLSEDPSAIRLEWQTNRKLQVMYLRDAVVEYSVTRTHGVDIDYVASSF
jgi:hypothetical protein